MALWWWEDYEIFAYRWLLSMCNVMSLCFILVFDESISSTWTLVSEYCNLATWVAVSDFLKSRRYYFYNGFSLDFNK